ncbi:hypothetical protein P389DRAFT_26617 [Cystobasidium minutum MCA 4210]|uniref:uncharacterized protein n=1 Tax=Cystobasidium minutum MCA 4210 TaxID=1397322 RepID=UPI0034CE046A|eukprot:jgi/Rhomi1/26617/CE26616_199
MFCIIFTVRRSPPCSRLALLPPTLTVKGTSAYEEPATILSLITSSRPSLLDSLRPRQARIAFDGMDDFTLASDLESELWSSSASCFATTCFSEDLISFPFGDQSFRSVHAFMNMYRRMGLVLVW